jgi:DNA (cytosine-5)-methyltransferase 3A
MSCGQIALKELGIKVDNYFAAEIDKHAIKVTKHNFPNTIHLGDVTNVKASEFATFVEQSDSDRLPRPYERH